MTDSTIASLIGGNNWQIPAAKLQQLPKEAFRSVLVVKQKHILRFGESLPLFDLHSWEDENELSIDFYRPTQCIPFIKPHYPKPQTAVISKVFIPFIFLKWQGFYDFFNSFRRQKSWQIKSSWTFEEALVFPLRNKSNGHNPFGTHKSLRRIISLQKRWRRFSPSTSIPCVRFIA